jgi:hypothetical protein
LTTTNESDASRAPRKPQPELQAKLDKKQTAQQIVAAIKDDLLTFGQPRDDESFVVVKRTSRS